MNHVHYWIVAIHRHLGKSGIAGMALLIASAAAWNLNIQPLRHRITTLSAQYVSIPVAAPQAPALQSRPADNTLPAFYRHFPAVHSYPAHLANLYRSARSEGLVLSDGTYHIESDSKGRLTHYEISLPMKGTYIQIRHFLRRIFNQFPTMALDRLTLRRSNIGDNLVEAKLHLVWYLQEKR